MKNKPIKKKDFDAYMAKQRETAKKLSLWKRFTLTISTLNLALSKHRYVSYAIVLSFPLFIAILIYLIPHQPNIPAASSLKHLTGKFDYIVKNPKDKYGQYTIDGENFNCGYILRLFPFDNCPMTREVRAFKEQTVEAKWYQQKIGFGYKPVLVEMIFDGDIKYMGIQDNQKLMIKLHKQNQEFFTLFVPIFFVMYFVIIWAALYTLYRFQKKDEFSIINNKYLK